MSNDNFNLTEFLPYQLSIASNAVSNRIARVYDDTYGLKVTEWRVMAMLGDAGALTQRQLAERTLMDKVAVNRACKMLEQRGLAIRLPNQRDGRSHHLELTDEGAKMHAEIVPLIKQVELELIAPLGKNQQIFRELLAQISKQAL